MSDPVNLQGQKLDLLAALDVCAAQKTSFIYITPDVELDFMEAVHNLTRRLPFMVQATSNGYIFNYLGHRYRVLASSSFTSPACSIGKILVHNFKGVSHTPQMDYAIDSKK